MQLSIFWVPRLCSGRHKKREGMALLILSKGRIWGGQLLKGCLCLNNFEVTFAISFRTYLHYCFILNYNFWKKINANLIIMYFTSLNLKLQMSVNPPHLYPVLPYWQIFKGETMLCLYWRYSKEYHHQTPPPKKKPKLKEGPSGVEIIGQLVWVYFIYQCFLRAWLSAWHIVDTWWFLLNKCIKEFRILESFDKARLY